MLRRVYSLRRDGNVSRNISMNDDRSIDDQQLIILIVIIIIIVDNSGLVNS